MIKIDDQIINDHKSLDALSAAERYAALALEKLRFDTLLSRVSAFFTERKKFVLMNAVKNEQRYLLEWLAYHRVRGVDGFVIFDNDSSDHTTDILAALHRAGLVCAISWPTVHPYEKQQISAFSSGIRALQTFRAAEWLGFLDVDEFYRFREPTLGECLAHLPEADAYELSWLFFGSGGRIEAGEGLVLERFCKRARFDHPKNWSGKPLARLDTITGHFHHPHRLKFPDEAVVKLPDGTVRGNGPIERGDEIGKVMLRAKARSAEILSIHHYAVRSQEEFQQKAGKGRINYRITESSINMDEHQRYFKAHDINEQQDDSLLQWADAVRAEMAEIVRRADIGHLVKDIH